MGERLGTTEKQYRIEAEALGAALRDALADLVQVHGVEYLNGFLERRLKETVENLQQDSLRVPSIRAAQRSAADYAEAALHREVESVRTRGKAASKSSRPAAGHGRSH